MLRQLKDTKNLSGLDKGNEKILDRAASVHLTQTASPSGRMQYHTEDSTANPPEHKPKFLIYRYMQTFKPNYWATTNSTLLAINNALPRQC